MVQVNLPYYNIRIKFNKKGDLQYISHLDLVRTMQKALKRAGLNMWYTEGFNPKPKMVHPIKEFPDEVPLSGLMQLFVSYPLIIHSAVYP